MSTAEVGKVKVGVVGVTGYAGSELARLLLRHPRVARPTFYLRNGQSGVHCLSELLPEFLGWGDAPCAPFSLDAVAGSGADAVFLSTPHEASLELVPELLKAGVRVIDLSGAFRFAHPDTFTQWYKLPAPSPGVLEEAVYGLPELYADRLPSAKLVANPGCYPTSVILALRPLIAAGLVNVRRGIVCDSKSGVTGAGKEPKRELHFVEVDENMRAYGLFTHRHTPEITDHTGVKPGDFIFSTHLLPVARGILSSLYVWLEGQRTPEEIESLYRWSYAGRPMVRIRAAGTLPDLHHVVNTNFCDIGFALDPSGERLVVVSCLDNLGKGAAGQAVQNFNGMLGFEEACGLK
jgi:N-acetyl-gamma-glutamyl-phosphate reductase